MLRRAAVALTALLLLPLGGCSYPAAGKASAPGRPMAVEAPGSAPGTSLTTSREGNVERRRPNIVFISTDDQADYDLRWMPRTRRLLAGAGVTFTDFVAPHPLCCPSRAMMLTGQYAQNNGVRHNEGPYGGYKRLHRRHTIATWLHRAGYQTAFVGKYLNGYEHRARGREPGWDIWNPIIKGVYRYYGFTMYDNGHRRTYTRTHSVDLVGAKTVQYIRRFARRDRPFFIWSSQVAPHGACLPSQELTCWAPPVPARRHAHLFGHVAPPSMSDPAYNEADVSDKPAWIRRKSPVRAEEMRRYFLARIRSLQAVDEAVAQTVAALRSAGVLANTLIVFTSDNGYLLGEHRLATKNVGYEQALQVPLLVRGPGIPHGAVRRTAAGTLDIAPTFLDAAHARPDVRIDGQSLLPAARRGARLARDTMLLQSGPVERRDLPYGWFYRGVRTARYTYLSYPATRETELYDRRLDPHELTSVSGDPRYQAVEAELRARLHALGSCKGAGCRRRFGPVPGPSPAGSPAGGSDQD